MLKEIKDKKITCFAITEKRNSHETKEFDEFDYMGDGIIFFNKRQEHDLDLPLTYIIQIQKMRLTKVNEMPRPFSFTNRGIELIGTIRLEKKIINSSINPEQSRERLE